MQDNTVKVRALYDSHVHWLMTGEKKNYLDIEKFEYLSDITADAIDKKNFRRNWLFGFGWTDLQLNSKQPYQLLDQLSSAYPICFIKKDAHSCLLNSVALNLVLSHLEADAVISQFVERDNNGRLTGVLKESAFYFLYSIIPPLSSLEIKNGLLTAQDYFLNNGFTHIRDMTCSQVQWTILKEMQNNNELKINADINFNVDTLKQATDHILHYLKKEKQTLHPNLTIKGIKIFYDGSLGSRTALLFENYKGTNSSGHALWSESDLYQMMKMTWENNFEFSVHTLGDKAVDNVVEVARRLYSEKIRGYLNLEHVQLIHPNTITKMKSLFVRCHMQPSHWLSDKFFLSDCLNEVSKKHLFSWEALRRAKVPISFGSDCPIEEANVQRTYQALLDSKNFGIEELQGSFFEFYQHPINSQKTTAPVTYFQDLVPIRIQS